MIFQTSGQIYKEKIKIQYSEFAQREKRVVRNYAWGILQKLSSCICLKYASEEDKYL